MELKLSDKFFLLSCSMNPLKCNVYFRYQSYKARGGQLPRDYTKHPAIDFE